MTLSDTSSGVLASLSDDLANAVQRAGQSVVAVHGRRRFPATGLAWRTDLALLPGLSGGAIADVQGRVVAMLSAYLAGGDPVGIPVHSIDAIVHRILSGQSLRRAYLGVSTQPVELQETLRSRLGIVQAS